jgi:DUF4097 and DUF4098 domain-containing protein YvlB
VLALAGSYALAQQVDGSFTRQRDVSTPLELEVATGSGSITVNEGAASRAEVIGRITIHRNFSRSSADAEALVRRFETEPPVELEGNRLRVGYVDDDQYRRNVSMSYEITVPADTRVSARSGSGALNVSGVRGPINVSTGSGGIALADVGGSVTARTGSGSIEARAVAGSFEAHTGSGSVSVEQSAAGDVVVSTGSGSAEVSGVEGAVRVRTGSGSVRVDGAQRGAWELQTGSGGIVVRLPGDAAFDLDAHAGSGEVHTEHPVAVVGRVTRGRLAGEVRGGGPLLQARTGSGGIRIE